MKFDITAEIKGKFFGEIKRADGTVRDTIPLQDNLITEEGLKFFLGRNDVRLKNFITKKEGNVFRIGEPYFLTNLYLGLGSGDVSNITKQDTTLGELDFLSQSVSFVPSPIYQEKYQYTITSGNIAPFYELEYTPVEKPTHMKYSYGLKFLFSDIEGVNFTELGLIGTSSSDKTKFTGPAKKNTSQEYDKIKTVSGLDLVLLTRAALKDAQDKATTLTLVEGETLEITYILTCYIPKKIEVRDFSVTKKVNLQDSSQDVIETFDINIYPVIKHREYSYTSYSSQPSLSEAITFYNSVDSDTDIKPDYDFTIWDTLATGVQQIIPLCFEKADILKEDSQSLRGVKQGVFVTPMRGLGMFLRTLFAYSNILSSSYSTSVIQTEIKKFFNGSLTLLQKAFLLNSNSSSFSNDDSEKASTLSVYDISQASSYLYSDNPSSASVYAVTETKTTTSDPNKLVQRYLISTKGLNSNKGYRMCELNLVRTNQFLLPSLFNHPLIIVFNNKATGKGLVKEEGYVLDMSVSVSIKDY